MQHTQISVPKIDKTNKIIVISLVACFLLQAICQKAFGISLVNVLGLSVAGFWSGHIYQLLFYPLFSSAIFSLLINALLFWFLGAELVSIWGRKRYISFLLTSSIGGGIIFSIIGLAFLDSNFAQYPISGAAGVVEALMVAYAILFPNREFYFMFFFPVKAKYFCLIIVGIQLYMGFFTPGAVSAWGHLGAMLSGFLWMIYITKMSGTKSSKSRLVKKSKSKANLRLVETDDEDRPPKYWQ